MVTVGVYSFTMPDWKEKDYPLDLWLENNLKIFDQVGLAIYGNMSLPKKFMRNEKLVILKITHLQANINNFEFYRYLKKKGQDLLSTDWKICLDTDEFITKKPNLSNLNRKYAYALKHHHLYGNYNTEILSSFLPNFQFRIHADSREFSGDAGDLLGPHYESTKIKISKKLVEITPKFIKNQIRYTPIGLFGLNKSYASKPNFFVEEYHTGLARNPYSLQKKWATQIDRERREGYAANKKLIESKNTVFDYNSYKQNWPDAKLRKLNLSEIPEIIKKNKKRFSWVKFNS